MITKVARINFPMDDDLHDRAKIAAIRLRMKFRDFVALAVKEKTEEVERDHEAEQSDGK